MFCIFFPKSDFVPISSRTKSPAETCSMSIVLERIFAYVPLPTPGMPKTIQFIAFPFALGDDEPPLMRASQVDFSSDSMTFSFPSSAAVWTRNRF